MKFAVVMETSTKDRDTIDTSKSWQKANEQLLDVSAPYSQSSYQNLKKLMGWHPASSHPHCTSEGQGILQRVLQSLSFHFPKQYSKTLLMT